MFFKANKHSNELYYILLNLSRSKFFYEKVKLPDTFETRIYLMFIHFSIILKIFKKKNKKFYQNQYDFLFLSIENNLRELGFGDVSVNEKMKNLNKILYDILLKIENKETSDSFSINIHLISKYFKQLSDINSKEAVIFLKYFENFYYYCFEIPSENVLKAIKKFKY